MAMMIQRMVIMSKIHEKGRKIVHRGLHALQPVKTIDPKTGQSLHWTDVRQELKDLIGLENKVIQSHLDDTDWNGRFVQSLQSYRDLHDGKIPNGTSAKKWAQTTIYLSQLIDQDHGRRPGSRRSSLVRRSLSTVDGWRMSLKVMIKGTSNSV